MVLGKFQLSLNFSIRLLDYVFNYFSHRLDDVFRLPPMVKMVLHPIICCTLAAEVAAFTFGVVSGFGFYTVLGISQTYRFYMR